MKLFELLKDIGIKYNLQFRHINISGISYNSSDIKKGFLFVAIAGFNTDGHKYIKNAILNQASLIAIENHSYLKKNHLPYKDSHILYKNKKVPFILFKNNRILLSCLSANFYNHPSKKVKLIGITGTNGKTTTSYLLEHILKAGGYKVGVIGTINYRIGKKIMPASATTPESLDLHRLLDKMVKKKVDYVIMEVSSHSLVLNRVDDCHFNHVIFTNLTEDHFDFHKNFSNYFRAKQKLFEILLASEKKVKCGFINHDDKYGVKILHNYKRVKTITLFTYGMKQKSDFMAKNIKIDLNKSEFGFNYKNKLYKFKSRLIGSFNIQNILAAAGIGVIEKISIKKIINAIAFFRKVPGRMEIIKAGDYYVGIDYAHTEDALRNVLQTVKHLDPSRIITVFGCGGDRDRMKRPLLGEAACKYSDYIILTSDNPRTEKPAQIIKEIEEGVKKKSFLHILKSLTGKKQLKKVYQLQEREISSLLQEKDMKIIK